MSHDHRHEVTNTYAEFCNRPGSISFQQDLSYFLLALDLHGESKFASVIWKMVTLALDLRDESYARSILDRYEAKVFSPGMAMAC